jgi:hypothetical protein
MNARVLRRLAAGAALLIAASPVAAQFGKNQVEYKKFRWQVIETQHFTIHYYPEEATIAMDVARMAERDYERLARVFQWEFRDKKPIMLFASRADFGENLVTGDLGEGTGGVTEPIRHRMLFFFTGNYRSTEHVLTHEMVHEFQFDIFGHGKAGGGLNALEAVNPPLWFMEGMAEYLSKGPGDPHTNIVMRDATAENDIPTMAQMTNDPGKYFPYRFGESYFAYVGRHWGDEVVGQIMLETPNVGVERAFERATNKTTAQIAAEWKQALQDEFLPTISQLMRARNIAQPVLTKHRTGGDIFVDPALSPDGKYLVFLSNGNFNKGEVFIDLWLADATTGERIKRLVKSTLDPNYEEIGLLYSQAAFSPDGKKLAFSALSGGKEVLYILDVARRKRIGTISLPLDGLTGPSWSPDGSKLVFSGAHGGITDIYTVDSSGKNLTQLTHDRNGDAQPQWSPDGKTIAFASERGAGTDLANLVFPRMRITLYHLDTHEIEVLPDQTGLNINPNWSPDGQTIAFISDRGGTPNVYLYDVASKTQFRITNFVGGVTGITDVSPALSWAHQADRLAFVYYENNGYSIWTMDDPRKLERVPVAAAVAVAPPPAAAPVVEAKPPAGSVAGDPVATYYKGPAGFRAAQALPRTADTTEQAISVAAILDTGAVQLPDTSTFFMYPYKTKLYPEYVASPTIGYSHDNFGSGLYGGTAVTLTDMVGATRATVALAVNGRLADFQFYAAYAYLAGRFQYQVGVQNVPFYYANGFACGTDNGDNVCISATTRYLERSVFGTGIYPLNRFDRWEIGVGLNALNRQSIVVTTDYTQLTQSRLTIDLGTKYYALPDIAYVSDNTLWGYFAPISGRRYRFEIQPAVGGFNWMGYLADYRRYDSFIFNKLILATHAAAYIKTGPDADSTRQYIAYSQAVRGFDGSNFFIDPTECVNTGKPADYCNASIGSSAYYGSVELRAPFYRGGAGSVIPVPPIELFVFADLGSTWFSGQTVVFQNQTNLDPLTTRGFLWSNGFGARINLFGAAIMSWAWVIPHDLGLHPYIQFSLYAPF